MALYNANHRILSLARQLDGGLTLSFTSLGKCLRRPFLYESRERLYGTPSIIYYRNIQLSRSLLFEGSLDFMVNFRPPYSDTIRHVQLRVRWVRGLNFRYRRHNCRMFFDDGHVSILTPVCDRHYSRILRCSGKYPRGCSVRLVCLGRAYA